MKKIAIVVHGGAGPDSEHIKQNREGYEQGLKDALNAGYGILEKGGAALDAVEAAVKCLEDNPLFNAGKGSAINEKAQVEMCASIMDGKNLRSGAVASVNNVRNPVSLARAVMEKTNLIYLGSEGATWFAKQIGAPVEPEAYFVTEYQYQQYEAKAKEAKSKGKKKTEVAEEQMKQHMHGTVGAVAFDQDGNVAAATSTGGMEFAKEGRIADSSMTGVGVYANNKTCAVSTTGDGEELMRYVAAHEISALMEYKNLSVQDACNYLIHEKCKHVEGDMGLIAVDNKGTIGLAFNSERMHRGWKSTVEPLTVKIYP